jgi:hypothetical protein
MESYNCLVSPLFRTPTVKSIFLIVFLALLSALLSPKAFASNCPLSVDGNRTYETNIGAYKAAVCLAEERILNTRPEDFGKVFNCNNSGAADSISISHVNGNVWDSYKGYWYTVLYQDKYDRCKSSRSCASGGGCTDSTYKKACKPPFDDIDGECATFCSADTPNLDLQAKLCYADKDKTEEDDYCELNPVNVNSGEKIEADIDLSLASPFPIEIKRIYQSTRTQEAKNIRNLAYFSAPTSLPGVNMVKHVQPADYSGGSYILPKIVNGVTYAGHKNWRILTLASLTNNTSVVQVEYNNELVLFDKGQNGLYASRHLRTETLKYDSSKIDERWKFRLLSGFTYYFNESGKLTKKTNTQEHNHYFSTVATSSDRFTSSFIISDDFSNTLKVTSNSFGVINKLEASNGITINYEYDNVAGNLISVKKSIPVDPSNPNALTELTKAYHYEDSDFPYALTGITDEKGIRYATWVYDDFGRVIQSSHANNVDNGTVLYEDNATTVTNALGKKTKYNYATVAGAKRLVNVDGIATPSCAAANKAYDYYSNGRIKTQTDWEGNVTYFEYNSKGQVTKRTDGYGTPQAYTVETSWHETLNEPSVVTSPDKQETFTYNAQGKLINKSVTAL